MVEMSEDRFAELVEAAFAQVPPALTAMLDNVVLFVEDDAPPEDPDLLGLYDGIPLTERDSTYAGVVPDRIFVFRGPLQRHARSREHLVREIAVTVLHELGHLFGISDERLHELGWG